MWDYSNAMLRLYRLHSTLSANNLKTFYLVQNPTKRKT